MSQTVQINSIRPELRKALDLFLDELDSHISYIKQNLGALATDETCLRHIEHRLHTIKGGAGFFEFGELRDSASVGEKMIQEASEIIESNPVVMAQLQEVLENLNRQASEIKDVYTVSEDSETVTL